MGKRPESASVLEKIEGKAGCIFAGGRKLKYPPVARCAIAKSFKQTFEF